MINLGLELDEAQFLYQVLDRVQISGLQNKLMVAAIMTKIAEETESATVEKVKADGAGN